MVSDETQKVCREIIDRLKEYGFYKGKKSSFDKAIKKLLSLYEHINKNHKRIYEQWKKNQEEEKLI